MFLLAFLYGIWISFICQTALANSNHKQKVNNSSSKLFNNSEISHLYHRNFAATHGIHGTLSATKNPNSLSRPSSILSSKFHRNYFDKPGCENVKLANQTGSLYNPGYPLSYKLNQSCSWYIFLKANEIVTLSFDDLDLAVDDSRFCQSTNSSWSADEPCCHFSAFVIKSRNRNFTEFRYCGRAEDNKHIFSTFIHHGPDVLDISFVTSPHSSEGRGFHATYAKSWKNDPCLEENEFKCANGKCIDRSWVCNRRDECGDNSDEKGCAHVCRESNEFKCQPQRHKSDAFAIGTICYNFPKNRCDGTWDCVEGTDEKNCGKCPYEQPYSCSDGQLCYSPEARCDGNLDCSDFKDEINCGTCGRSLISCGPSVLRECYHPSARCNGIFDCPNGRDEMGCERTRCGKLLLCSSGEKCFSPEKRCNGSPDCLDSSDEKNCTAHLCRSEHGNFLCANRNCIKSSWICDRSDDCGDNSDEFNCLRNSVITAVLMGSLICGVLLVIAISCTCKLIALRQFQHQNYSHSESARGSSGATFNSSHPYHRYFPFGNTQTPSNSLFILDNEYFYRDPPPSYAHAVASDCDRSRRRNPRRIRPRNRRRPPTPPPSLQQSPDGETSEALMVASCPSVDSCLIRAEVSLASNSGESNKHLKNVKVTETNQQDANESGDEEIPTSVTHNNVNIELSNLPSPQTDCDQQPLLSS